MSSGKYTMSLLSALVNYRSITSSDFIKKYTYRSLNEESGYIHHSIFSNILGKSKHHHKYYIYQNEIIREVIQKENAAYRADDKNRRMSFPVVYRLKRNLTIFKRLYTLFYENNLIDIFIFSDYFVDLIDNAKRIYIDFRDITIDLSNLIKKSKEISKGKKEENDINDLAIKIEELDISMQILLSEYTTNKGLIYYYCKNKNNYTKAINKFSDIFQSQGLNRLEFKYLLTLSLSLQKSFESEYNSNPQPHTKMNIVQNYYSFKQSIISNYNLHSGKRLPKESSPLVEKLIEKERPLFKKILKEFERQLKNLNGSSALSR